MYIQYLMAAGKDATMEATDFLPAWWDQDLADQEEKTGSGPSPEQLRAKINLMFQGLGGVDTTSGSS